MKRDATVPYPIQSITELHHLLALPKPEHPLVSVVNLDQVTCFSDTSLKSVLYNFYSVCIKKDFTGKMKYGQNYYDFDEGTMTFFSPGQVTATDITKNPTVKGWWLIFHPDFIQNYPLSKTIKDYGYFSYAVNEALHLSDKEETLITGIMQHIHQEYQSPIDAHSQSVMVSHIDLLLTYCNRFYSRQFITRRHINNDLLSSLEALLTDYFASGKVQEMGLPTVQYVSSQLNLSPNYLSDLLRSLTGQSTQQHIHDKLIEKAREMLTTTSLSVSEVAYELGFEYPQSFSKLFKSKTSLSPVAFRQSFN